MPESRRPKPESCLRSSLAEDSRAQSEPILAQLRPDVPEGRAPLLRVPCESHFPSPFAIRARERTRGHPPRAPRSPTAAVFGHVHWRWVAFLRACSGTNEQISSRNQTKSPLASSDFDPAGSSSYSAPSRDPRGAPACGQSKRGRTSSIHADFLSSWRAGC